MDRNKLINTYKKFLIEVIDILDIYTTGRKNKFPTGFYLGFILRILFYNDHWNTFVCPVSCDRSTIRKKFIY